MKNLFISGALALLVLASCSKEENDAAELEIEQQAEALEDTPLDVNTVSENVSIKGGVKNTGTPPTPNEAISLDLSEDNKNALLGEGFDVSFTSDASIVGAYVQFKANDGTVSDSYYDVNLIENNTYDKASKKTKSLKSGKINTQASKDGESTIDIDFGSKIEPGTFCYVLCVYDAQGNISAPSDVCVTVESWGGNSDLVASWSLEKSGSTYNGTTETELIGEEDCYEYTQYCSLEDTYKTVKECDTFEYAKLLLNADGTYIVDSKGNDTVIDDDLFDTTCEVKYQTFEYSYKGEGNWAYNSDTKRLTIVEYKYTDTYLGESTVEILEAGDGELVFDGIIDLEGNSLIIREEYGGGESYVSYFVK